MMQNRSSSAVEMVNGRAPTAPLEQLSPLPSRLDRVVIPLALAAAGLCLYLLTGTGFHTFDAAAYIRDMEKPLQAMVLPTHLIYEPVVLALYRLWQALGWTGYADRPAEVLSSLAGAGGLAVFYKIAWEAGRARAVGLLATLALALSYGYWFYGAEIEVYLPPFFFLLVTTWLLSREVRGAPVGLCWAMGLIHAGAVLFHQVTLLLAPAFALGLLLIPGRPGARIGRVARYGGALAGISGTAYLIAGVGIAGQRTPEGFLAWVNTAPHVGTWGVWRADILEAATNGLSATVSADFWVGRLLPAVLLALVLLTVGPITRRGGPFAAALLLWLGTYGLFFAWWDPENLKFWVFIFPTLLLLGVLALPWPDLPAPGRRLGAGAAVLAVALLALTNAPVLWQKRDPLSDPERQVSEALVRLTAPEDLIVLQAGSAEQYLPFYYRRENIMSTRELWYTAGGAPGREAALDSIRHRMWHALATGASVWLEDRVLTPGVQSADHYVFSPDEIARLLAPYEEPVHSDPVPAGPETFQRITPAAAASPQTEWTFASDQAGWSGVNLVREEVRSGGWCFQPGDDPNLYGPPVGVSAAAFHHLTIAMTSPIAGHAQLFYRTDTTRPYAEAQSVAFPVAPGAHTYTLDLATAPGWTGTIGGIRVDPVEHAAEATICVGAIRLQQ